MVRIRNHFAIMNTPTGEYLETALKAIEKQDRELKMLRKRMAKLESSEP